MTKHQLGEQEVQIARYQLLSQEVTDPFAACLLRVIIEELEADLRRKLPIDESCCRSPSHHAPQMSIARQSFAERERT